MGCGCKEATKITSIMPKTRQRRDICRSCQHATRTRRTEERFVEAAGLTTRSICEITSRNIAELTADSAAACPLGSWDATARLPNSQVLRPSGPSSICPYAVPNCCGKPAVCPVLGQCDRDWRVSHDCPTRATIENH